MSPYVPLISKIPDTSKKSKVVCCKRMSKKYWTMGLIGVTLLWLFADQNLLAPNLTAAADDFGMSDHERDEKLGGQIALGFFVLGAPAALAAGYWADLYNRCHLFGVMTLLSSLATGGTYFVQTYEQLFFVRTLTGIGIGAAAPITFSIMGDFFSLDNRIYVSTYLGICMSVGISLGQLIAGLIGPTYGWRLPFLIVAIPAICCAIAVLFTGTEPNRGSQEEAVLQLEKGESLQDVEGQLDFSRRSSVSSIGPTSIQGHEQTLDDMDKKRHEYQYNPINARDDEIVAIGNDRGGVWDAEASPSPSSSSSPSPSLSSYSSGIIPMNKKQKPDYNSGGNSNNNNIKNPLYESQENINTNNTNVNSIGLGLGAVDTERDRESEDGTPNLQMTAGTAVTSARDNRDHTYSEKLDWDKIKDVIKTPSVTIILLQGLPGCIPWGIFYVYLNDFLSEDRGFTVEQATAIVTCFGIGGLFGQLLGGWTGQKLYTRQKWYQPLLMGGSTMLSVVPLLVLINSPGGSDALIWLSFVAFTAGVLVLINAPNINTVLQNVCTPQTRGSAFALYTLTNDIGRGGGPLIVAGLVDVFGDRLTAYNVSFMGLLLCGAMLLALARTVEDDELKVQTEVMRHLQSPVPIDVPVDPRNPRVQETTRDERDWMRTSTASEEQII